MEITFLNSIHGETRQDRIENTEITGKIKMKQLQDR
jgi:hypothetical protein